MDRCMQEGMAQGSCSGALWFVELIVKNYFMVFFVAASRLFFSRISCSCHGLVPLLAGDGQLSEVQLSCFQCAVAIFFGTGGLYCES